MSTVNTLLGRLRARREKHVHHKSVVATRGINARRAFFEQLEVRDLLAANFPEFLDPHPAPGNQFGAHVVPLSTGNVVITSPYDDAGATDAGAVYLFDGATGALISTLTGSSVGDAVGSGGVTVLANGNYVIQRGSWHNAGATNAGAVTWGSGTTGISGVVSSANSLVAAPLTIPLAAEA